MLGRKLQEALSLSWGEPGPCVCGERQVRKEEVGTVSSEGSTVWWAESGPQIQRPGAQPPLLSLSCLLWETDNNHPPPPPPPTPCPRPRCTGSRGSVNTQ